MWSTFFRRFSSVGDLDVYPFELVGDHTNRPLSGRSALPNSA
jgi:hypothetical protein